MDTAALVKAEDHPPQRNETVLVTLTADFDEDGRFGHRDLIVTADEVRVVEGGGAVSFRVPISELKSARNEPLVGGGRLEVTTKGGEILPVLTYSLTSAAKF